MVSIGIDPDILVARVIHPEWFISAKYFRMLDDKSNLMMNTLPRILTDGKLQLYTSDQS